MDFKTHFRHLLLFHFWKGKSAAETRREICDVYGAEAITSTICQFWFKRFRSGEFNLEDVDRPGRPTAIDDDKILQLIKNDRQLTTREISQSLNVTHATVANRLKKLGMVKKSDVWVPHELSERNLIKRIDTCDLLLKRYSKKKILKRLITGDEKWIVYNNVIRKRSWYHRGDTPKTVPKAGLHPVKVMLCIWWDYKGVVYYELLPQNQTITSSKYCLQLSKLKLSIKDNRKKFTKRRCVVFQHDNARPHVSLTTRRKLLRFGWDILPHPPYSPDIAPSDYHLFRSLQNHLNGKRFKSLNDVKSELDKFFAAKPKSFYRHGIMQLPERWRKIISQNGEYITD